MRRKREIEGWRYINGQREKKEEELEKNIFTRKVRAEKFFMTPFVLNNDS